MPYNGSGVFVPTSLPGSFNPAISGQQATPTDWNTLLTDLTVNGLSNVICKDGQTTVTANIPFGGFRITNVGNATALTDATTAGQVQDNRATYALDTGSVNAFAIAPVPACAAYKVGQSFQFRAIHSNNITNPTLNVNGLGAGVISWASGAVLSASTIVTDGLYEVIVATNTPTFHLQTPVATSLTLPTTQKFTSGSAATYTTPTGVKWIRVRAWGGGGGGAGCPTVGNTQVAGTVGADTLFNSVHAGGGAGGSTTQTIGGGGGTSATGTATLRLPGDGGENGSGPNVATAILASGGGGGPGGAAGIAAAGSANTAGNAAAANTSGGGSGAYNSVGIAFNAGAGGGAGEYIEILINNPSATYTYTVGAGGAGGVSDTNGGAGGSGLILVEEFYQP